MAKEIPVRMRQTGLEESVDKVRGQIKPIDVPVNVNPAAFKNLSQPLGRITGLATEFEKSIAASNARVIAFGASVGIINGFQNALSNLVKTGIEVQKTLADISAISGLSGAKLSELGNGIFDVARNTGQSFKVASEAALEFSRQGLGLEQTLKRTNDALTLSRFTGLSAAESVDVLTAAVNSFQDSGVTTAQILNKLVAVDSKYAVSSADLAKAISRVGSVGIEAGVSLDELNAAVTAVQERTARGGAVIGNAFKTIFTNLRSENAVKALREIGVESLDLATGKLKPAIQVLKELSVRLEGLGEGDRVQILETVASKYNINILSALTADLASQEGKFVKALEASAKASTEAYDRQIELNKTLQTAIQNTETSVTQLFNRLSEIGVTENLSKLLTFVNNLLDGFNKFLDSEVVGADIAKGLIKGISDVFFTVGLPIIGAIFVKLTRDIAQFGFESLKTILGINKQVKERQALEQAVVNTLIKDQQVMATILALSGSRAKQEQYLLGVYNQQIAALQKVQSIAQSVTPALQGAGLLATSGGVRKRAAGGYLPSQEASDVRRGVGGASPSSKVVSIPNFAFGSGKRGTMIANTSEYIVPNFANGGSAIFNPDMVKAYGLPDGAKKITAAGGYIPNFKKGENLTATKKAKYENAVTVTAKKPDGAVMLVPSPSIASEVNQTSTSIGVQPSAGVTKEVFSKTGKNITGVFFDAFGLNDEKLKSSRNSKLKISEIQKYVENIIGNAGKTVVNSFKPLNRPALGKEQFLEFFYSKGGASGAAAAVAGSIFESAVDYALNPNSNPFAKDQIKQTTLDVQSLTPELQDAFGVGGTYGQATRADYKISAERRQKFADQIVKNGLYTIRSNAAAGYVPNFAKQSPLSDAIGREIGAGVRPSQVRVTQDGRLRNAQNPNGLAVINTRDEPNGRIPNFVGGGMAALTSAGLASAEDDPLRTAIENRKRGARASQSEETRATRTSAKKMSELESQTGKATIAFSALTIAMSTFQSTVKDSESTIARVLGVGASGIQGASTGFLIGSLIKDLLPAKLGKGFEKSLDKTLGKGAGKRASAGLGRGRGLVGAGLALTGAAYGIFSGVNEQEAAALAAEDQKNREAVTEYLARLEKRSADESDFLAELTKAKEKADAEIQKAEAILSRAEQFDTQAQGGITQLIDPSGGILSDISTKFLPSGTPQAPAEPVSEKDRRDAEIAYKKALEESKQAQERITKIEQDRSDATTKKQREEEKITKLIGDRIPLEKALRDISLAFLQGDQARAIKRAKTQADDIKNASKLNVFEEQRLEITRKLEEIQDQREKSDRENLATAIEKIKSEKIFASLSAEQRDNLIAQIKSGEDLGDTSQLVAGLSKEQSEAYAKVTEELTRQTKETQALSATQSETFLIVQRSKVEEENRLRVLQAKNNLLKIEEETTRNIAKIRRESGREEQLSTAELDLARLEAEASTQANPSALMTKEIADARKRLEVLRLTLQVESEYERAQNEASQATKRNYIEQADALSYLNEEQRKALQEQLRAAEAGDLEKVFARGMPNITGLKQDEQTTVKGIYDAVVEALKKQNQEVQATLDTEEKRKNVGLQQLKILSDTVSLEERRRNLRVESPARVGVAAALDELEKEGQNFSENFAKNTTLAFRDGLTDALSAAISQTDDLGDALQNVARNFLQTIQQAFLQRASGQIVESIGRSFNFANGGIVKKYAGGGKVVGGSGYKDDVPAMLTSGEFVMRKSAVQKYGAENLEKMNNGGIFLPGVRGAGAISGYGDLTRFAKQTTTSGATDVIMGGGSSAFINLEDQSARLSRFGLLNEDTINQEIRAAQEQGLGLIREREAYRTAQRKAFQKQIVSTVASAVLSYGVDKLIGKGAGFTPSVPSGSSEIPVGLKGASPLSVSPNIAKRGIPMVTIGPISPRRDAYGGLMRRYAAGGPTDDIPALLMGGEYVMSRQSTRKYGKQFFDAMNQGRAPRFAEGGMVGGANGTELGDKFDKLSTKLETTAASNISININVTNGGATETQTQGDTNRGGIDYKKMGDQIRQVVIQTINEEKRLGGSLRTR